MQSKVGGMHCEIIGKIGSGEIVVPSYYDFDSYEAFATYRDDPNAEFVK